MKKDFGIEAEGRTIEEAVKKALEKLKVRRNEVKVKVLSEEARGLFGMPGAKPAKVRVSLIKNKEKA